MTTSITADSVKEDTDTVEFTLPELPPTRPMVTGADGQLRELDDFEMKRVEAGKADRDMRREAASAQAGGSTIDRILGARPRPEPKEDTTVYQFAVSPSIHEDRVFSLTTGEDDEVRGYLTDASDFLRSTRTTLEKIDTAYRDLMLDKSLTPDARTSKLEAATSKAFVAAFAKHGAASEALGKKIAFTDAELAKPLEAQAATARSSELRAVLRDMKSQQRNELIRAAISAEKPSAQQLEILQSVLGANHITVGISEVEQAVHVRTFNERNQPQLLRRLDLMKKSLAVVQSVKPETLRSQFEGSMRSPFSRATSIRGISEAAQKSLDAINGG